MDGEDKIPVMRTKDLVERVAESTGIHKNDVRVVINAMIDTILGEIVGGRGVRILRLGKFIPYVQGNRPVRDPRTNKEMTLQKRTTLKFRVSSKTRALLKDLTLEES